MSGERMGVPFPWADVRLLYLPVFSFFEVSHIPASPVADRDSTVLAVDVEGPVRWNNVENGYDAVKTEKTGGCGNDKRGQMRWKKREQDGMRKRMGGRRNMRQ